MKTSRNVLSFTTAIIFLLTALGTQLAMAADPFEIYKSANFKGRVNNYGVGQHEFTVGGDSKTMGSFKVPAGLSVTFYDASGVKGERVTGLSRADITARKSLDRMDLHHGAFIVSRWSMLGRLKKVGGFAKAATSSTVRVRIT